MCLKLQIIEYSDTIRKYYFRLTQLVDRKNYIALIPYFP